MTYEEVIAVSEDSHNRAVYEVTNMLHTLSIVNLERVPDKEYEIEEYSRQYEIDYDDNGHILSWHMPD